MRKQLQIRTAMVMMAIYFLGIGLMAQSGWQEVYSGSNMFMRDMCFVPGDDGLWQTGWAISYEGDIIKTTDGGDTWTEISQSLSTSLAGLSFADEETGFIATLDNKILKSTDGGTTWTTVYSGGVNFDKIAMKDASNGVASGTSKLYTSDGGTTWTTGTGGSSYWDLDYGSANTYYGVNLGGSLGQSTDGGSTWSDIGSLGVMCMMTDWMDDTHGMFGGDLSTLKVTHNGGSTWQTNTLGGGQDAINCGGFFDQDTIYAAGSSGEVFKSTDGGENWSNDTSWASGVFQPRDLVVTGMNVVFVTGANSSSEGKIWRKIGAPPIGADFEADETVICAGSSVDFSDLSYGAIDSWTWDFEGGTPATSTDQNPTVTYAATGKYDVKLVVTVGGLADSITKTEYIEVVELPAQAATPEGDTEVCTGLVYEYTIDPITYGHEYEWEIDPVDAGTLTWEDTDAQLTVANDWTGDFSLRVRTSNVCGDGDWSDYLEGTAYPSPTEFALEGGGGYCLNTDGVEITLDGSETGIDYELYLGGVPTGNIVEGTGSEISFGLVTDEGYYAAIASSDNCDFTMQNQVQVYIEYPPLEPGTPEGPEVVCDEETSEYTSEGTDDADDYVWLLSPEEAGTITYEDLSATVTWNESFKGQASITLYGINNCGDGNVSNALEVTVGEPEPVITGEELVCDWSDEFYEVEENEGSTYTWEVTGGEIIEGQGTYMVTIAWQGEGSGTVTVEEESAGGCTGVAEMVEVLIDDCTSIGEKPSDDEMVLYPNPASETVSIRSEKVMSKIVIFSLAGSRLLELKAGQSQISLNVSELEQGMYLVRILTSDGLSTKRLVVE